VKAAIKGLVGEQFHKFDIHRIQNAFVHVYDPSLTDAETHNDCLQLYAKNMKGVLPERCHALAKFKRAYLVFVVVSMAHELFHRVQDSPRAVWKQRPTSASAVQRGIPSKEALAPLEQIITTDPSQVIPFRRQLFADFLDKELEPETPWRVQYEEGENLNPKVTHHREDHLYHFFGDVYYSEMAACRAEVAFLCGDYKQTRDLPRLCAWQPVALNHLC
jgi:hypothetical protein